VRFLTWWVTCRRLSARFSRLPLRLFFIFGRWIFADCGAPSALRNRRLALSFIHLRRATNILAFRNLDRLIFTSLAPRVVNALVIVQPKTVIIALSGATQRQDGAVSLPDRIKGIAVQKLATSLMDKGFVREIRAKPGMPAWRRDEDGRTYALVIADPNAQIRIKPITSCLAWRRSPVQPA
jgi:hypothetical protein